MSSTNLLVGIPKKMNFIFIGKKPKRYLHVDLDYTGEMQLRISKSDDGFKVFPVANEPAVDSLPKLSGNLLDDSLAVIKHFRRNGFKEVNTFSQTKTGSRLS